MVAFEVIEHLTDYRAFLDECARVLTREGLFIVSSPNKRYYAETRAETGPNPFHEHEFEAEEFVRELRTRFPECSLAAAESSGVVRISSGGELLAGGGAHRRRRRHGGGRALLHRALFARARCPSRSLSSMFPKRPICCVSANCTWRRWSGSSPRSKRTARLYSNCFGSRRENSKSATAWAQRLDTDLKAAGERIVALQNEAAELAAGYQAQVARMEQEDQVKTEWARKASAELEAKCQELAALRWTARRGRSHACANGPFGRKPPRHNARNWRRSLK